MKKARKTKATPGLLILNFLTYYKFEIERYFLTSSMAG